MVQSQGVYSQVKHRSLLAKEPAPTFTIFADKEPAPQPEGVLDLSLAADVLDLTDDKAAPQSTQPDGALDLTL